MAENDRRLANCGHLATPLPESSAIGWCRDCRDYVLLGAHKALLRTLDGFVKVIAVRGPGAPPPVISVGRIACCVVPDVNPEAAMMAPPVQIICFRMQRRRHRLWIYEEVC